MPKAKPLAAGRKAPKFKLPDQNDETLSLDDFEEDYLVLFFYPKDSTPGCTIEANEFQSAKRKFSNRSARAIGISGGNAKTKTKFCSKNKLKLTMLSDEDFKVASKFGVYGEKKFMGKTFDGIHRVSFVIGPDRKIIEVIEGVKPVEHPQTALSVIDSDRKA